MILELTVQKFIEVHRLRVWLILLHDVLLFASYYNEV